MFSSSLLQLGIFSPVHRLSSSELLQDTQVSLCVTAFWGSFTDVVSKSSLAEQALLSRQERSSVRATCEQPQAEDESSPATMGMRSLLFVVTTGLNASVNWEVFETGKVYSHTLFKIGLHLKVYFVHSQNEWMNVLYPDPYGCLPAWDIWWSCGSFVSSAIGMCCQTGAACMHIFVFLFVFAVSSCLILFQSMFLAMWVFFPTQDTLKVVKFTMFMERC